MALATQCPHCQTTFRVAHDQLKLRAGLVRCGACKEIFNGIEHLLRAGEGAQETLRAAATASMPRATPLPGAAPVDAPGDIIAVTPPAPEPAVDAPEPRPDSTSDSDPDADPGPPDPAPHYDYQAGDSDLASGASVTERFSDTADLYPIFDPITPPTAQDFVTADDAASVDPLQRMTLIQFSDDDTNLADQVDTAETEPDNRASAVVSGISGVSLRDPAALIVRAAPPADELDQAIDHLQRRPWRGSKKTRRREDVAGALAFDSDAEEPGFMTRARRSTGTGTTLRGWSGLLVLLLVLAAFGQTAYALRDQIAARLPVAKPWLIDACAVLGCQIDLPAQADAISIESDELTILNPGKNSFALALVLRNRSSTAQRWPHIELTLLDASERPVIRRMFDGRDYLTAGTDVAKGFAANSEQTARITFEMRQQKASNYRVYSFYP